jgi:hypothetical protein
MIEVVRAYRGMARGIHGERWVRIQESVIYRCTECKQVWDSRTTAQGHECPAKQSKRENNG